MKTRVVKTDLKKLDNFVASLSDRHAVRVGIFSKHAGRDESGGLNNPTIGAIHEFGSFSRGIPARSFLRMPLHKKSEQIVTEASQGAVQLMTEGKFTRVLKNLGIACENAIQEAFETKGFGSWAPLAYSTIMHKLRRFSKTKKLSVEIRKQLAAQDLEEGTNHAMVLIQSGQLRGSIASEVVKIS